MSVIKIARVYKKRVPVSSFWARHFGPRVRILSEGADAGEAGDAARLSMPRFREQILSAGEWKPTSALGAGHRTNACVEEPNRAELH
jgi:hypothetical protein